MGGYARPAVHDEIAANNRRSRSLVLAVTLPVVVLASILGALVAGPTGAVVLAVVAGAGTALYVLRAGPAIARRALGGRPADPVADARLFNLVEGLGGSAGVPVPELVVVDDPAANALSFGRGPHHACVVVTRGLLERLNRVELEGVLARELGRIKSHDVEPATVAVAVLNLAGTVRPLADWARRTAASTGPGQADANGVRLTRYPPGLAAALSKVADDGATVRAGSAATAHLWLEPPDGALGTGMQPPIDERIHALREL